jgi:hypothetical protein
MVADEERMKTAIDRAVAARLARHPPFYVPATDFAPPKGLVLHATTHRDSRFPFALALNGFVQGRWLNLARGTTQWIDATGNTEPVVNEFSGSRPRIAIAVVLLPEPDSPTMANVSPRATSKDTPFAAG